MAGIAWPASQESTSIKTSPVQKSTTAWWKTWSFGPSMKSRWHLTTELGWEPSAGLWQSTHCREVSKSQQDLLDHPTASSGDVLPTLEPRKPMVTSLKFDRQLGAGSTCKFQVPGQSQVFALSLAEKAGSEGKKLSVLLTLVMTCWHTRRAESAAAEVINRNADESWGPGEWIYGTCDRQGLRLPCQES